MIPNRMHFIQRKGTATLLALSFLPVAHSARTLENLQAARQAEIDGQARYVVFARQADAAGYGELASLFRALAMAESVQANQLGHLILKLGGSIQAEAARPDAGSLRSSLETALHQEMRQRDFYNSCLQQENGVHDEDVIRAFARARAAEQTHAQLLEPALRRWDQLQGSAHRVFYVCTVCGYTVDTLSASNCPSCFALRRQFRPVS